MYNLISLLLVFLIVTQAFGQQVINLWPDDFKGPHLDRRSPAVKPDRGDDVVRLTNVTNPTLTVYPTTDDRSQRPAVIVCPGGGYAHLAVDKEGHEIAEWLNSLGVTAFVLTYRVPDQRTAAIQDLQRAIRLVRHHRAKWQLDTNRIGVIGFSAGANLAVWSETTRKAHSYEVLLKDVSCHQNYCLLIYPAGFDEGTDRSLTSGLQIDQDMPPTFIFATADDRHANSALVMASALRDENVSVEFHLMPEGGHGYGLRPGNAAAEIWPQLAEKWWKEIGF